MKCSIVKIVCGYLLLGLCACTNSEINAAGAIAYAHHGGKQYILLADHTGIGFHRGYGAFGGALEKGETLKQGALREFHEETACHFLNQVESISIEYVRNNNYISFVVQVPFISSEQLNTPVAINGCSGDVYSERKNWLWVEQQALLKQLKKSDQFIHEGVNISLWDKSSAVIKKAQQQGLLQ